MILRACILGVLIMAAEVLQGILRVRFLNRRVGDRRARQIGVFTGSAIILVITWFCLPWVGAAGTPELLAVGVLWLLLMLGLDVGFGRLVFRASWDRIVAEFDLRRGGLLGLGMLLLLTAPLLIAKVRGLPRTSSPAGNAFRFQGTADHPKIGNFTTLPAFRRV